MQLVNERLGGIGADVEAGTGGRPIELAYCGHLVTRTRPRRAPTSPPTPPEHDHPGVDFFTPLMYPLFAEFPVVEMLPIFIADFDQTGVYGIFGGCVTAFPSSAEIIADVKGHDRLAVIWSDNAPGNECWTDTHERFYQYYADTLDNFEFQGFPYTPATRPPSRRWSSRSPTTWPGPRTPPCTSALRPPTARPRSSPCGRPGSTPRSTPRRPATARPSAA